MNIYFLIIYEQETKQSQISRIVYTFFIPVVFLFIYQCYVRKRYSVLFQNDFLGQSSRSITWESDLTMRRQYYAKRPLNRSQ